MAVILNCFLKIYKFLHHYHCTLSPYCAQLATSIHACTTVIKVPFAKLYYYYYPNTEFLHCTGGVDYNGTISVHNFTPSALSTEFTVPIVNDNMVETDEVFFVELFSFRDPLIKLVPSNVKVTILDDDSKPRLLQ